MFTNWFNQLSTHPSGLWGPLLEIAILTVLIYIALSFIRGTRGAGILRGLGTLGVGGVIVILLVARVAELENIRWLMENLLAIGILAVIVVFQPEIRRALIRIGENPVWGLFGERGESAISEVVKAAASLSRKNIGAIIVIERETRLGTYIEGGVRLDAAVGSELLCTIFHPKTPLHDGAVIIRNGRIVGANCLLPFTENTEICRGMGARHRAGIGLSEEADAVVVIISEETGRISVAISGKIQLGLEVNELHRLLSEQCAAEITDTLLIEEEP
ncbi:MAG: diadenylate cyclase CdaA [Planctomycetes bacterium]|nr:diadenylate cyclase CdaA [Planctomycetota bacterium]